MRTTLLCVFLISLLAGCQPPESTSRNDRSSVDGKQTAKNNSSDVSQEAKQDGQVAAQPNAKTFTANAPDANATETETQAPKVPGPDPSHTAANPLRILAWNVESDGNDPIVIAEQLKRMDDYHIYALSEAGRYDVMPYADALGHGKGFTFFHFGSSTGRDDRLAFIFDSSRLELIKSSELFLQGSRRLNDWRHRSPLVGHFRDKLNQVEFLVTVNHLARGNAKLRTEQAAGLREWAAEQTLPVIAVGDYNLDYDFPTEKGNSAFDEFVKDDTWTWVKPAKMIDTNWADYNGDGVDDYPDSMLDFAFVAGEAKSWNPKSKVITRRGDFPDNDRTSDHRPVELILQYD